MLTMGLLVHLTPFEIFFWEGGGGQIEMKLKRTNMYVYILTIKYLHFYKYNSQLFKKKTSKYFKKILGKQHTLFLFCRGAPDFTCNRHTKTYFVKS